jgi:quercetin dioxygenase-like cupin family protein
MLTLPAVHRVVTGHDAAGKAVVIDDQRFDTVSIPSGDAEFAVLWSTPTAPVDNDDTFDGRDRKVDLTLPGGSVLRIVDMLPGKRAPMHRTNSLDYGIVLSGAIELVLDDGATTLVEAGGVVIQRGTIHSWYNPSTDETARIAFVLLDATPATVGGVPLPDIHPRTVGTS